MKGQLPCGQSQNSSQSGKAQQSHSGADSSSDIDQMDGSPPPPSHHSQPSHGTPCSSVTGHQVVSVNGVPQGMARSPSRALPPVDSTQPMNSQWPGGISLPLAATSVDTKPLMTSYEQHLGHLNRNQMELKPAVSAVPGYEYAVRSHGGYPAQLYHPPPNMCFNYS